MGSKRYMQEQMLKLLKEVDAGATIASPFLPNVVTPSHNQILLPAGPRPHDFFYSPTEQMVELYNHEFGHIEE